MPPVWMKILGWGGGSSGRAAGYGEIGRVGAEEPEGKPGGETRGQRWVVPRRHKSLPSHMSVFIFRRGYPFFGYPYRCCRATFMSDECQTNVRQARIDCKMTLFGSHQTLVFMGFCRFAYAKGVQNDVRRMSDECQEGEFYRRQSHDGEQVFMLHSFMSLGAVHHCHLTTIW